MNLSAGLTKSRLDTLWPCMICGVLIIYLAAGFSSCDQRGAGGGVNEVRLQRSNNTATPN